MTVGRWRAVKHIDEMNSMSSKFELKRVWPRWAFGGLLALALAGCGRDEIKVYKVAKEDASVPATPAMPGMAPGDMAAPPAADPSALALPPFKWTLPADWQVKPAGAMRAASFSAPGTDGKVVDISIVPLPGMAGGDLSNVNRWRGQVGLEPIQEDELAKDGEDVLVGDAKASLYDLTGTPAGTAAKARILAVGLHREEMMWFFKATGDDISVGLQKTNFISFLKSFQFTAAEPISTPPDHPAMAPEMATPQAMPQPLGANPAPAPEAGALPAWTVPSGWQAVPPTQMLLAKFSTTENDGKADVTVSSFPGDVGGLLANVNRWRRQISLPPLAAEDLARVAASLDLAAGPASLVDVSGTDAGTGKAVRLVGVILPLNGQTWFYKFMGDAAVVEHQKADFIKFVQTVKY
jgi:hypothetical protein